MRKIIFCFIMAFIISIPYASAERLLDIGAELFYQRYIDYMDSFEYTKLVSKNDVYYFGLRDKGETICVSLKSTPDGYVYYVMIEGSTIKRSDHLLKASIIAEEIIGLTAVEKSQLRKRECSTDMDDVFWSSVWCSSSQRSVARVRELDLFGTLILLYSNEASGMIVG